MIHYILQQGNRYQEFPEIFDCLVNFSLGEHDNDVKLIFKY